MAGMKRMPSTMGPAHKFSMVPRATIERSVFDRSRGLKTTFDAGNLVPVFMDLVFPGDTVQLNMHGFCRLSTPLKPVMDNMWLESFFFAVPLRLLWSNFQKFMGEQLNPGDSTSYTIPQETPPDAGYVSGRLEDYFGLPVGVACTKDAGVPRWSHSALWRRAYNRIYNEWFRDENLCARVTNGDDVSDGPDAAPVGGTLVKLRGKRHDYFTSCLPWPQKGTAVSIPLGTSAPVYVGATATAIGVGVAGSTSTPGLLNDVGASNIQRAGAGGTQLQADMTAVTGATINALRQSFQIQKLLERDARGGTRYTEIVRSHFGVVSPDARLQRPEYLGGGSSPVIVSPVAQTAPQQAAGVTTPQGNLAAIGTAAFSGHGFMKSFTEHCVLLGLVNVRADLTYQKGFDRMWSYLTRNDFYWPAFAHIGEQAVLNKEIFVADNIAQNNGVFGYQERYGEMRYGRSLVTGLFRSGVAGSLDVWHLSENFSALPTLNQTFIEDQTTSILTRVLAVPSEPDIIADFWLQQKWARPMPVYSVPGLIDHF